MKSEKFILIFWKYYISLEKDFISCFDFVELDEINYSTYSTKFAKLILEIGSEIDVVLKKYCRYLDKSFRGSKIDKYHECILKNKKTFSKETVDIYNKNIVLTPWVEWNNKEINPLWWKIYNQIKHERTTKIEYYDIKMEAYKFGTLGNTLNALAGLYQILIYFYYDISSKENNQINSPLPGSRLFQLSGPLSKKIVFYTNDAFYIEDGKLMWEHGSFYY